MVEPAKPIHADVSADSDERRMREDAEEDERMAAAFEVTVHDSLEAAEQAWRALEAVAAVTPYQRYDWLRPLLAARGTGGARIAVAIVAEAGRPVAMLPLAIERRFGIALGRFIGWDVANLDWMTVVPSAAPAFTRQVLDRLLADIAKRAGGIDALSLHSMPAVWQDVANPFFAYRSQPGPDHLYLAPIGENAESRINAKRLRNIMRGKRRLEETMGPVVLRRAETPETVAAYHRVFLEQRAARFAEQGIANVFAEPWCVRFFSEAATGSLGSARPVLRFHALFAGDEIVATSCGTYAGGHFSQYINSMTAGPAAKASLMGLLMSELVDELGREGITSIDMGLGDFDYKLDWTDRTVVHDAVIPLTPRGRAAAAALLAARRLRRAIKQNEVLFGAFKRLRALVGRRRNGSG